MKTAIDKIIDKVNFQLDTIEMDFANGVEISMRVFNKMLKEIKTQCEKEKEKEEKKWVGGCKCDNSIGQTWCCNICGQPYAIKGNQDSNAWISVDADLPQAIDGKKYSENVLAICDNSLMDVMVMARIWMPDDNNQMAWFWANCYGDINGDGEVDDNYVVTHWQPIPKRIKK